MMGAASAHATAGRGAGAADNSRFAPRCGRIAAMAPGQRWGLRPLLNPPGPRLAAVLLAAALCPALAACALIAGLPEYTLGTGGAGGAELDGGAPMTDGGAD